MIEAVNLTKHYEDGTVALDHLNLKVGPGEIFGLLGANGAGKTTAINLFLGFIDPTEGDALVNGISVPKNPLEAKKYVAYVSENVQLYGSFTARQNGVFVSFEVGKPDNHRIGPESSGYLTDATSQFINKILALSLLN